MADIFISYASQDSERAKAVGAALRAQGWTVWWDDHISPGDRFDQTIEAELAQARCVVVLWSQASVASGWVREEAHEGKKRAVLVPALIADVEPPFGYRTVQAANLVDWAPGAPHREFDALVASIEQLAPRPKAAPPRARAPAPSEGEWRRLLVRLREGTVVPVVGARLLHDPAGQTLQARLAAELLADHETDAPPDGLTPFRELDEAVGLLKARVDPQELYLDIHQAMRDLQRQGGFAPPQPLLQLAQISDFRLMVTLTPDELLAQALRARGRGVNEVVHSPQLPTSECSELSSDWRAPDAPVQLLYLFGRLRAGPVYAISDHEVEQYLDNLQGREWLVPKDFLDRLRAGSLLLIGAQFPGWLTRRIARTLGPPVNARALLPDDAVWEQMGACHYDALGVGLAWGGPPEAFVDELHRRWFDGQAAPGSGA